MRTALKPSFTKSFKKLSSDAQRQTRKALALFKENPNHPSLNFELVDKKNKLYTIRVNKGDRVLLICLIAGEFFQVLDVGSHDYIYKKVKLFQS